MVKKKELKVKSLQSGCAETALNVFGLYINLFYFFFLLPTPSPSPTSHPSPPLPLPSPLSVPGEVVDDADSGNESRSGSEETHVCEKCCAEFFKWSDFCEHLKSCTKNPLVLIVNENEATPDPSQEYPGEPSPAPSCPSDPADSEEAGEGSSSPAEEGFGAGCDAVCRGAPRLDRSPL